MAAPDDNNHVAIPLRSATTDSKTPYNYAHTSTPQAAWSHRYSAAAKKSQTDRSRNRPDEMKGGVWRVQCEVWSVGREECSVKSEVWSVECEVWSLECEESSEKWEVWSVECEVWSLKSAGWSEVWSAKSAVWSVECEVCSVECEECSEKCEVLSGASNVTCETGHHFRRMHARTGLAGARRMQVL